MKKIFTYVLFGALFFVLAAEMGCTKQDLDRRKKEGFVKITLSWPGDTPKGSKFYFYPEKIAEGEEFTLENPVESTAEGWSGYLPEGTYRVIVHNSDAEGVAMRYSDKFETAEIYVLPAEGSRAGECICHPDKLMLATAINEHDEGLLKVVSQDRTEVTATPTPRVKYLRILFDVGKVDEPIALSSGTLFGVAPSLHCASSACASTSERVEFPIVRPASGSEEAAQYAYQADIRVLDLVQPTNASHMLTLNLTRADGTSNLLTYDLTKEVNDIFAEQGGSLLANHLYKIVIELKKIGNDLKVGVVEWTEGTGSGTLE